MLLHICNKFHENIIDDNKVIEQKRFPLKFSRENNLTKIVGGVTVLVLSTLSDTSIFFYPVS